MTKPRHEFTCCSKCSRVALYGIVLDRQNVRDDQFSCGGHLTTTLNDLPVERDVWSAQVVMMEAVVLSTKDRMRPGARKRAIERADELAEQHRARHTSATNPYPSDSSEG